VESRVAYAFRLATARLPDENESGALQRLLGEQMGEFERDRAAADSLLAVGQFEADPALDKVELAAWTTIATVILNLDETVTKS
jgi:hypothetical protein